jgi:predicted RNA-binding protein YlxR (DUF448 family)
VRGDRPVLRRCVACRTLADRRQLWRVIRLAGGGFALDRGMGRSAYVCPSHDCLLDTQRRRRLQRALRCQVPVSILECLQARLQQPLRQDEVWPASDCGLDTPVTPDRIRDLNDHQRQNENL